MPDFHELGGCGADPGDTEDMREREARLAYQRQIDATHQLVGNVKATSEYDAAMRQRFPTVDDKAPRAARRYRKERDMVTGLICEDEQNVWTFEDAGHETLTGEDAKPKKRHKQSAQQLARASTGTANSIANGRVDTVLQRIRQRIRSEATAERPVQQASTRGHVSGLSRSAKKRLRRQYKKRGGDKRKRNLR